MYAEKGRSAARQPRGPLTRCLPEVPPASDHLRRRAPAAPPPRKPTSSEHQREGALGRQKTGVTARARPANPGAPSPGVYPRCPPPQLASAGALPRHRRLASPPRAKHQREGALGRQKTGVPAGAEPANPGAPSPGVYPRCPPPQLASAGALPRSAASDALPPDHCPLGVGPVTTRVRVSKLLKLAINTQRCHAAATQLRGPAAGAL